MKKIVISGPPHSGKTTLIQNLKNDGFFCIDEIATKLIQEKNEKLGIIGQQEWLKNNYLAFQEEVAQAQLQAEQKAKEVTDLIICDRGIFDVIAFSELRNTEISQKTHKLLENYSYDLVIFLPFLNSFQERPESGRTINKPEAEIIEKLLYKTYEKAGIKSIKAPVLEEKELLEFVKKTLSSVIPA